jgi:hypothetical protein
MEKISKMSDIGKDIKIKLEQAVIKTPSKFRNIGSNNAYLTAHSFDRGACPGTLCALEVEIKGVFWHDLQKEVKSILRDFIKLEII